jgi:hypothetical protein
MVTLVWRAREFIEALHRPAAWALKPASPDAAYCLPLMAASDAPRSSREMFVTPVAGERNNAQLPPPSLMAAIAARARRLVSVKSGFFGAGSP